MDRIKVAFAKGNWYEIAIRGARDTKEISKIFSVAKSALEVGEIQNLGRNVSIRPLRQSDYVKRLEPTRGNDSLSFIHHFFIALARFICLILRIETFEDTRRFELALAMQAFKQEDPTLIQDLFGRGKEDLTFSRTIEIWKKSIEDSIPYLDESSKIRFSNLVKEFSQLSSYQKRIEALQKISSFRKLAHERHKFNDELSAKISSLREGEKILFPGGTWDPNTHETCYGLYEYERKENKIVVRILDVSGADSKKNEEPQVSPKGKIQTQAVTESVLLDSIAVNEFVNRSTLLLTGVSISPVTKEDIGKTISTFKLFFRSIKQLIREGVDRIRFGKNVVNEHEIAYRDTTRNVAFQQLISKGKRVESAPLTSRKRALEIDPYRILRVFTKVSLGKESGRDLYLQQKLLFKGSQFLKIYESASKSDLAKPEFRSWLKVSARKFIEYAEEHIDIEGEHAKSVQELCRQVSLIVDRLELEDAQQRLSLPKTNTKLFGFKTPFKENVQYETPIIAPNQVHAKPVTTIHITTPLRQEINDYTIDQLRAHVDLLQTKANGGSYSEVHFALKETFLSFEDRIKNSTWIPSLQEHEKWSQVLKDCSLMIQQVSYGLKRIVPSALDLRFTLLSLRIQDMIIRDRTPTDHYAQGFVLDLSLIKQAIQSPYFSFDDSSSQIAESLDYFDERAKKCTKISMVQSVRHLGEDIQLWEKYVDASHSLEQVLSEIGQSGNGHPALPQSLIYLRQSSLAIQTFAAPTRTLIARDQSSLKQIGKTMLRGLNFSPENLGGLIDHLQKIRYYPAEFEVIKKRIENQKGPIQIKHIPKKEFNLLRLGLGGLDSFSFHDYFSIEPLGLGLLDSSEFGILGRQNKYTDQHPDGYLANGVAVLPEIRDKLFETVLSENYSENGTENGFDEQGRKVVTEVLGPMGAVSVPYRNHRLNGITEQQVLSDKALIEKLSSDVSQGLKLCMTGNKSRVQNLISFYANHKALLEDSRVGPSLSRLFEHACKQQKLNEDELRIFAEFLKNELNQTLKLGLYTLFTRILSFAGSYFSIDTCRDMAFKALKDETMSEAVRRELLQEYLSILASARDQGLEIIVDQKLIENFIQFYAIPRNEKVSNPLKEERIAELSYSIQSAIGQLVDSRPDHFCNLLKSGSAGWRKISDLKYASAPYEIDFSRFVCWKEGKLIQRIPRDLLVTPEFAQVQAIVARENSAIKPESIDWTASCIEYSGQDTQKTSGMQYDFNPTPQLALRIILGVDGSIRLYRKRAPSSSWYQYQPHFPGSEIQASKDTGSALPRIGLGNDIWVRADGQRLVAEKRGAPLWRCAIKQVKGKPLEITSMRHTPTGKFIQNVWDTSSFNRFLDIEDKGHIIALGRHGHVDTITYQRSSASLSYSWDDRLQNWKSMTYKGYALSDKPLNHFLSNAHEKAPFQQSFKKYHLLENRSGNNPPLLILPGVSLNKQAKDGSVLPEYRLSQDFGRDTLQSIPIYTYTVDSVKGLVADQQPDGYFYLAYSLAMQGNLEDAFLYLGRGDCNRPLSEQGSEYLSQLEKLLQDEKRPNVLALKARIKLIRYGQSYKVNSQILSSEEESQAFHEMYELFHKFQSINKHTVQLHPYELDRLKALGMRSTKALAKVLHENMEKIVDWNSLRAIVEPFGVTEEEHGQLLQDGIMLHAINPEVCSLWLSQKPSRSIHALIKSVADLEARISKPEVDTREQSAFNLGENSEILSPDLTSSGLVGYAKELMDGLSSDLHAYRSTVSPSVIANNLQNLNRLYEEKKSQQLDERKKALSIRQAALKILSMPPAGQKYDELKKRLELTKGDPLQAMFEIALRSYGEKDFLPLKQLLGEDLDVEKLKPLLRRYLIHQTQAQHLTAFVKRFEKLFEKGLESEEGQQIRRDILQLLNTKRAYDPLKDELAESILLIEHELGFLCRTSQIEVIRENLAKNNLFKLQQCGGGKTTVLRNVISHILADGKTLGGVSTHAPLRFEHGLLYARTTKTAYGEQVFDFRFDRSTASDEASLLQLYWQLLRTTVERGRIDLTKSDLQSFRARRHFKSEEIKDLQRTLALHERAFDQQMGSISDFDIAKAEETQSKIADSISQLHREIDIMDRIRPFMKRHIALVSDELDKDTDPTEELNYEVGTCTPIEQGKIEAVSLLFTTGFESKDQDVQKLMRALRANIHYKLSPDDQELALQSIAKEAAQKFQVSGYSQKDIAAYLYPASSEDESLADRVWAAIQSQVEHDAELQKLSFLRQLMTDIAPEGVKKRGGVSYGFSQNGRHIIPFLGSDKPKEGSIHGTDMERLFYTYLQYLDESFGVSQDQVHSFWMQIRGDGLKEMSLHPEISTLDMSTAAQRFKELFPDIKKPLSAVHEEDVKELTRQLNSDPFKVIAYLKTQVLPDLLQGPEKIPSNAQDSTGMVRSNSGSSGTDTACNAMPDKIDVRSARQKTVHGEILNALLEIHNKNQLAGRDSFLTMDREGSVSAYIAKIVEQIRPGDCISDVAKLFGGIAAENIARILLNELVRQRKIDTTKPFYIEFMNREDSWQMLSLDGRVITSDPSVDPKQIIRFFDDVHTRGAHRLSSENVTEFVTLDLDTDWSSFEQGLLRERGVPKGRASVVYLPSFELSRRWNGQTPSINNLVQHFCLNEEKVLKPLNVKNEKQTIEFILRDELENSLSNIQTYLQIDARYRFREIIQELTRSCFFVPTSITALSAGAPSKALATTDALDLAVWRELEKTDDLVGKIQALNNSYPQVLKDHFLRGLEQARIRLVAKLSQSERDKIVDKELLEKAKRVIEKGAGRLEIKYLPEVVRSGDFTLSNSNQVQVQAQAQVQVQTQTQAQKEVQTQKEVQSEVHKGNEKIFSHIEFSLPEPQDLFTQDLFRQDLFGKHSPYIHPLHEQKEFPFIKLRKFFTENFCPVDRSEGKYTPWDPFVNQVERSLFVIDTQMNEVVELLGSRLDLDRSFTEYKEKLKGNPRFQTLFYNYGLGTFEEGKIPFNEQIQEKILQQIVATKILTLRTSFSAVERNALKNLMATLEPSARHELRKTLASKIAQHRPSVSFNPSDLDV